MNSETVYIEELDLTVKVNVVKDAYKTFRDGTATFGDKFFKLFPRVNKNTMEVMSSLIVAHACAGMKVDSKLYVAGLKTFFENL